MADRPSGSFPAMPRPAHPMSGRASTNYLLLRRAESRARTNSTQLVGFLALAVTLADLLVLAGVTLTVAFVALVVLSPVLLLTSPLWLPVAFVVFVTGAASLFACCLAVAALGAGTWAYRYFTGRHPVGAHRVGYARGRVADTASQLSQLRGYYERECGGYPRVRVKDAAPGA